MKPYNHFTLKGRESLAEYLKEGLSMREIAKKLNRSPSTISREIKRNYSKQKKRYNAWRATTLYIIRRKKCVRKPKITQDTKLHEYIKESLNKYWTPEEISGRGKLIGINVSYKSIYTWIKQGYFAEITPKSHLRRRGKRKKSPKAKSSATITPELTIHQRDIKSNLLKEFGHFEGDTILGGIGKGGLVSMVDIKSKFLILEKWNKKDAQTVKKCILNCFNLCDIPVKSITLDNGSEFAEHKSISQELATPIYFCDTHSPWQRGLNENTNDLVRFFYPKGTNFLDISDSDIQNVVNLLNNRPRKCLGFLTPIEILSKKCCT